MSSLIVSFGRQIGPSLARQPLGLGLAPPRDLLVVAAQQYRRYIHSAIARRPGIARRRKQAVVVRVRGCGLVVPQRAREQPYHRIQYTQRRRLTAREHEVADRQLLRSQPV